MAARSGRWVIAASLAALLAPSVFPSAWARDEGGAPTPPPQVRALLAPRDEAVLASQIPGRVATMAVRNGQAFKKDDVLFALDCRLYQAQLDKARAELAAAERTLTIQRRLNELGSGNRLDRNQAEGAVARGRGDVAQLVITLDLCAVKAPFDGRVVERKAQPFQTVAAAQPVLEVQNTSNYDIQMLVPSGWLAWMRPGVEFRLHLDETGQDQAAVVETLAARIDPASQSLKVIGRFQATPSGLIAGMSGTAFFQEGEDVVSAPPAPPADAVARPRWLVESGVARPVWEIEARR